MRRVTRSGRHGYAHRSQSEASCVGSSFGLNDVLSRWRSRREALAATANFCFSQPTTKHLLHGHAGQVGLDVYNGGAVRSEEHTSELQSPMYLVCRLLLEKKKQQKV